MFTANYAETPKPGHAVHKDKQIQWAKKPFVHFKDFLGLLVQISLALCHLSFKPEVGEIDEVSC
jgi:hypothetical protein